MRKYIVLLLFLISAGLSAQELNCRVLINSSKIQNSDKQIYNTMKTNLTEFMNNTKWTDDVFGNEERIECTINITIDEQVATNEFRANIAVQSTRPIYKTSYNSTVLNINDNNFRFEFSEFEPLVFNKNTHTSNLTSVLAFYAYIILGVDYDTYATLGGEPYYLLAKQIVGNAQGDTKASGWKSFEGNANRYWLSDNLINSRFKKVRTALYNYHRKGLDVLTEKATIGRSNISDALKSLLQVSNQNPNAYLIRVFFDAKADEIVNIFSQQDVGSNASELIDMLTQIDPSNSPKWEKMKQK